MRCMQGWPGRERRRTDRLRKLALEVPAGGARIGPLDVPRIQLQHAAEVMNGLVQRPDLRRLGGLGGGEGTRRARPPFVPCLPRAAPTHTQPSAPPGAPPPAGTRPPHHPAAAPGTAPSLPARAHRRLRAVTGAAQRPGPSALPSHARPCIQRCPETRRADHDAITSQPHSSPHTSHCTSPAGQCTRQA